MLIIWKSFCHDIAERLVCSVKKEIRNENSSRLGTIWYCESGMGLFEHIYRPGGILPPP